MRTFLAAAFACTLTTAASAQVSDATRAANAAFAQTLPWADREDEDFANSGFNAGPEIASIGAPDGRVIWDFRAYDFLHGATLACLRALGSSVSVTASIRCAASTSPI